MTDFEQKLLETLSDISEHLKDLSIHTADVNIELEHLNEKDFTGDLSSKLTDIACFVSEVAAK